jgi:hypothetical protein
MPVGKTVRPENRNKINKKIIFKMFCLRFENGQKSTIQIENSKYFLAGLIS